MKIYGVAILAACFLAGKLLGSLLGGLLGINADVGGVGFAMALLIFFNTRARRRGELSEPTLSGILFWSGMYIPIVVAMAASLNVKAALSGGWVALLAGVVATLLCLLLVPVLTRMAITPNDPADAD